MTAARARKAPAVLDALGDATRRSILELLENGARSVREIADELPVTRSAVSQHLRVLKQARLVTDRAEGTRRIYNVTPEGFSDVQDYLDLFWRKALSDLKAAAEADAAEAVEGRNLD
jgi:DNA-binding transcriptional ArsR family regulator